MNPDEIEVALQAAFNRCNTADCPLTEQQKQIILQALEELTYLLPESPATETVNSDTTNPLDELTPDHRQRFLQFVKAQEQLNRPWKIQLLNDWLQERTSGSVQFIRDLYGPQWLNRLKPGHFAKYTDAGEETLKLKVGDRIEVSNSLWEWVQENGPCSREWFTCTVIQVAETGEGANAALDCIIRFSNGAEYEIQSMYGWNRYNWRWPQP